MTKPKIRRGFQLSTAPADPKLWPLGLTVEQKLRLLGELTDVKEGIEELIDKALREEWRSMTEEEVLGLLDWLGPRGAK